MRLDLDTAPASEPLTTAEAKLYLKIDDTAEDTLVDELVEAATDLFEEATGRQVIAATYIGKLDGFPPAGEAIRVPKPPLSSITSITYLDTAGVSQTWAASKYTVQAFDGPFARHGRVFPVSDETYPDTRQITGSVTVTFVAGYADAASTPESVRTAIREILRALYERDSGGAWSPQVERIVNRFRLPVYA